MLEENVARMLQKSRCSVGRSQEYMANALGISRKTVQNWENAIAVPNLIMTFKWFDTLSIPMYPYIMEIIYPKEIEGITAETDINLLRSAAHTYVDELDDHHLRELLYLLHGSHGSSPTGTLDIVAAYLHMPLTARVPLAEVVATSYEMAAAKGELNEPDHVKPQVSALKRYINSAKAAALNGKHTYLEGLNWE